VRSKYSAQTIIGAVRKPTDHSQFLPDRAAAGAHLLRRQAEGAGRYEDSRHSNLFSFHGDFTEMFRGRRAGPESRTLASKIFLSRKT